MKIFLNNLKLKYSLKNRACIKLNEKFRKNESWAIVTGCTSGIGKSYAEILCQNNFNLILIARNEEKLNTLNKSLSEINKNVELMNIKWDYSDDSIYTKENYEKYLKILSEKDIRLLINNVGETTFGGDFYKYDPKKNKSLVNVNINSTIFTTNLFINSQINFSTNEKKFQNEIESFKRGIINISSYYGLRPVPGNSIYSSTKSFISNFSTCLYYEVKNQPSLNLEILCMNPLFVQTGMVKWNNYFIIKPEEVVYSSFLRINEHKVHSYGHWKHVIQSLLLNLMPNIIFCRITEKFFTNQYKKLFSRRRNVRNVKNTKSS
jgi:short-subunit dehydrogenase